MKEKPDTRMDPVLGECYRMKEVFAAKFNSMEGLYNYLKANQKNLKHSVGNICPHRHPEPNLRKKINLFARRKIAYDAP